MDYILGDESTADETFSSSEQGIVKNYLSTGGNLFVSSSEIGWDLDTKGSADDKSFAWNYLKIHYLADAPLNQPGVYYQVEPVDNSIFTGIQQSYFDNGLNGTINVKYPDALRPDAGAKGCLKFTGVDTASGYAGIFYSGLFPNSAVPAKVLCLSVPFESIYPDSNRTDLLKKVITFFESTTSVEDKNLTNLPKYFHLSQNYPNPFNPTAKIRFSLAADTRVSLIVYDLLGRKVSTLIDEERHAGNYEYELNASEFSSGIYFYKIQAGSFSDIKKMCVLK